MSKIIPSQQTGPTRIDEGGPFVYHDPYGGIPSRRHYKTDILAHSFESFGFCNLGFRCTRCNKRTMTTEGIRDGCHMFSSLKSDPHWACNEQKIVLKPMLINVEEEYIITGCHIHGRSEWVKYPNTGKAIQEDKFINEQVIEEIKYACIRR